MKKGVLDAYTMSAYTMSEDSMSAYSMSENIREKTTRSTVPGWRRGSGLGGSDPGDNFHESQVELLQQIESNQSGGQSPLQA